MHLIILLLFVVDTAKSNFSGRKTCSKFCHVIFQRFFFSLKNATHSDSGESMTPCSHTSLKSLLEKNFTRSTILKFEQTFETKAIHILTIFENNYITCHPGIQIYSWLFSRKIWIQFCHIVPFVKQSNLFYK